MKHIKYKYRDALSNWEWREKECLVSEIYSAQELKEKFGLDVVHEYQNYKYQIISVEDVK